MGHRLLQIEALRAPGRVFGGHPKWRPRQHWARGEEREGSIEWGLGAAGLGSRKERVGLNRGREDVNQALFSRGKASELGLRQTVLPGLAAGVMGAGEYGQSGLHSLSAEKR